VATSTYETLFLLDSNRYARDPGGVSAGVQQLIETCGGKIQASRLWNEQKLAYPIEGHQKGIYWLAYYDMDSLKQPEFTRACQLHEAVVRQMTVRLDPRLVGPMVALARGERPAPVAPATVEEPVPTA
jgi:small subunit ribosomal protein S6